jgi:branched-subunit amino acid transport protein AzlD
LQTNNETKVGFMEQRREQISTHMVILAGIFVGTAVLRFWPGWVLQNGPTCVFHTYLHLNCPFCGMTRDFVAILHGQQPSLNRFSWIAAITLYLGYPACFFWAWSRQRLSLFYQPAVHRAVAAALVVMLVVNNLPR